MDLGNYEHYSSFYTNKKKNINAKAENINRYLVNHLILCTYL